VGFGQLAQLGDGEAANLAQRLDRLDLHVRVGIGGRKRRKELDDGRLCASGVLFVAVREVR
jgi:hypothetical protein